MKPVLAALPGPCGAALRAGTRRLEGQFQLPAIGKPTTRRGPLADLESMTGTHDIPSIEQQLRDYIAEKNLLADHFPYPDEMSSSRAAISTH